MALTAPFDLKEPIVDAPKVVLDTNRLGEAVTWLTNCMQEQHRVISALAGRIDDIGDSGRSSTPPGADGTGALTSAARGSMREELLVMQITALKHEVSAAPTTADLDRQRTRVLSEVTALSDKLHESAREAQERTQRTLAAATDELREQITRITGDLLSRLVRVEGALKRAGEMRAAQEVSAPLAEGTPSDSLTGSAAPRVPGSFLSASDFDGGTGGQTSLVLQGLNARLIELESGLQQTVDDTLPAMISQGMAGVKATLSTLQESVAAATALASAAAAKAETAEATARTASRRPSKAQGAQTTPAKAGAPPAPSNAPGLAAAANGLNNGGALERLGTPMGDIVTGMGGNAAGAVTAPSTQSGADLEKTKGDERKTAVDGMHDRLAELSARVEEVFKKLEVRFDESESSAAAAAHRLDRLEEVKTALEVQVNQLQIGHADGHYGANIDSELGPISDPFDAREGRGPIEEEAADGGLATAGSSFMEGVGDSTMIADSISTEVGAVPASVLNILEDFSLRLNALEEDHGMPLQALQASGDEAAEAPRRGEGPAATEQPAPPGPAPTNGGHAEAAATGGEPMPEENPVSVRGAGVKRSIRRGGGVIPSSRGVPPPANDLADVHAELDRMKGQLAEILAHLKMDGGSGDAGPATPAATEAEASRPGSKQSKAELRLLNSSVSSIQDGLQNFAAKVKDIDFRLKDIETVNTMFSEVDDDDAASEDDGLSPQQKASKPTGGLHHLMDNSTPAPPLPFVSKKVLHQAVEALRDDVRRWLEALHHSMVNALDAKADQSELRLATSQVAQVADDTLSAFAKRTFIGKCGSCDAPINADLSKIKDPSAVGGLQDQWPRTGSPGAKMSIRPPDPLKPTSGKLPKIQEPKVSRDFPKGRVLRSSNSAGELRVLRPTGSAGGSGGGALGL